MVLRDLGPDGQTVLEQVLGYLNFSSGAPDAQFLGNPNQLFRLIGQPEKGRSRDRSSPPTWQILVEALRQRLKTEGLIH